MNIKKILFVFFAILSIGNALAIDQIGIAYRYNGKKQRSAIGGVYVKVATSPNGVVSNEPNGQFVLKLKGIDMGDPMGLATVTKKGMMVFNKEEVDRWSVQKKPLVLIVCDANEFQKQKDRLITIGQNQAEKRYKQKLAKLEAQNAKKQLSLDLYNAKLDSIEKEKSNALAHMDEYADLFARIDESEIDTIAQKAVDLFKQGYIDEAIDLFKKNDPIAKIKKSVRIREQAEEMRQLADSAESLAQQDIDENTKNAKAYIAALKLKNDWEEAGRLLKELADALGTYDAIGEYADFSRRQNQYTEAETYYKLCKDKIVALAKSNPEIYEPRLAAICINLGLIYNNTQRFNESEQMHKAALDISKRLADSNPQAYEPYLAASYNNLANLYYNTQRFNEAERMHKAALEILKRLADANPQAYEPDLAMSYNNLALLYSDTQRFNEAEQMHKSALDIRKRLAAANPQAYEPYLATSYNNLANLYYNIQRFNEAEQIYKAALEIYKRLADANPQAYEPYLAASYNNLANLYYNTQRFNEAEQMYKSALEIRKHLAEANPRLYNKIQKECLFWLADSRIKQEKYSEAIAPLEEALDFYKKETENGVSTDYYYSAISRLDQLYSHEKEYSQAYQCLKKNIPILRTLYQSDKSKYTELLNDILVNQSCNSIFEKQYTEAEAYSKEALEVDSTKHIAYSNLAAALLFQGKYQEAKKVYRQYKSELKEGFLSDFEEFAKAGVIPKNREEDVKKIKNILEEE